MAPPFRAVGCGALLVFMGRAGEACARPGTRVGGVQTPVVLQSTVLGWGPLTVTGHGGHLRLLVETRFFASFLFAFEKK